MKRITYEERKVIEKLLKSIGRSWRKLGKALGRSHSVIKYEVEHHCSEHLGYEAERAQGIYERNQLKKGNVKKLKKNKLLCGYVIKKLKKGLSPELISGRLRSIPEEQERATGYICHETIYNWIHSDEMKKERLWKYLRRHKSKRYKQGSRKSRKGGTLKNITSISKRPKEVDTRNEVGHWESDSMQFSRQKGILSVQVERKTRQVRITKCRDKTAEQTKKAIIDKLRGEDYEYLKTITFDRGTEGAYHEKISQELAVDIYFCHPYSSWEKGAVENRNMFIREYLPLHTKIAEVSDEYIYEVQEKLNNRPMKCLNYRTPNEMVFYEKYHRFPPLKWNEAERNAMKELETKTLPKMV